MKHLVNEELKIKIQKKLKNTFTKTIDNPVIKAHDAWSYLSDQLLDILGHEVHTQWFKNVQPLVLKSNVLLLQSETQFSAQWINTHYQKLADALIMTQDKKLTCFFISPKKNTN